MLFRIILVCMCITYPLQVKAEKCTDSINNNALDLNFEDHRKNDYEWKAESFFSMDYKSSCGSTRYDIKYNVAGKPTRKMSNILDLNTSGGLKENGDRWVRHDAMLFGYKYHGLNKSGSSVTTSLSVDFAALQFLDIGYTYGIDLGPVQAGARVGVSGEVTLAGGISKEIRDTDVTLGLFPGFNIYGYAKVGAGIAVLAEVWAGGQLSFIKESLTADLVVKEKKSDGGIFPKRDVTMRVYNNLEFLSGKLYVKAKVLLTTWEHKFIEFWGYRSKREIWSSEDSIDVKRSSEVRIEGIIGKNDDD